MKGTAGLGREEDLLEQDTHWMTQALQQARLAQEHGEVPVGAVLVADQQLLATGFNQVITLSDPTAHAEIQTLRAAGQIRQNYRLLNTTLYVTLEPCLMCVGALLHARIQRLVFAASEPKTGAVCSVHQLLYHPAHNHQISLTSGLLASQSALLLTAFFAAKR